MITLIKKDRVTAPLVYCDVCKKRIDNAGMALYVWNTGQEKDFKIIHKGTCDTREYESSMELRYFFIYLMKNTGIKRKDLDSIYESAELMEMI